MPLPLAQLPAYLLWGTKMDALFYQLIWKGLIGALLPSIGFGVLFNVRGTSLLLAGLTGGIGGFMYQLCLYCGFNDSIANFIAAVALSICGEIFARKMKTTVSTFTAVALIPLVPGGGAYEMMVYFSQGNTLAGLMKGVHVLSVSGMLCLGILIVSTITRFFFYSKRKLATTSERLQQKIALGQTKSKTSMQEIEIPIDYSLQSDFEQKELLNPDKTTKP